jgi:hypothetical protein
VPTTTLAEFRELITKVPAGGPCVLQVQRAMTLAYVVLELP